MLKTLLLLFLFNFHSFAFDMKDIASNFDESTQLHIIKRLDLDKDFIYDTPYNNLLNELKQIDIISFKKAIEKNPEIFFTLKQIIRKSDVPDLFLYMAMIESQFLIHAKSQKKAVGLWQILPSTAKLLKLKMTPQIDERRDPIKSTQAAIRYLSYLHKRFKKWYLAALAYNCGETRLSRAIKKAQSDDIFALLDPRYSYLPKETKDYIRRLIVSALIAQSAPVQKTIRTLRKKTQPLLPHSLTKTYHISDLAQIYHITPKKFKHFNAHIKKDPIKAKSTIYLPKSLLSEYRAKAKGLYTPPKDMTLYHIAQKFHLSFLALQKLNPDIHLFAKAGQKIKLPAKVEKEHTITFKPLIAQKRGHNTPTHFTFPYVVQPNDTLLTISLKFNNKITTIQRLNPNIGYRLETNQTILLMR